MFPKLFRSGHIGELSLPNRIIMAPMLTCFADGDYVSDRLINFLAERAKGGAGMITTEVSNVNPMGSYQGCSGWLMKSIITGQKWPCK
jgi:2,4-dienoyl-CoA reductase (NADPH2)